MPYNPQIHHRHSIRLKGYDYRQAGLYFITVCVQNRLCLFGKIIDGQMILNGAGQMVVKWYMELENKYPDKICHQMVVMPNHFHCIIENAPGNDHFVDGDGLYTNKTVAHVDDGADMDAMVAMETMDTMDAMDTMVAHVGAPLRGRPENDGGRPENDGWRPENVEYPKNNEQPPYGPQNQKYNADIAGAMDWFKTMTTNEYIRGVKQLGWPRFDKKLWQRRYWEHIIRNQQAFDRISNYIINNPANWENNQLNPK
jgi:putative transposase